MRPDELTRPRPAGRRRPGGAGAAAAVRRRGGRRRRREPRTGGAAGGVPVHTAKFHLDKLVDEGLLEVEYRRLTGRTGPGSGRPAKLYRRADRELAVSLPARQYDLLSRILASAVASATTSGEPVVDVAAAVARTEGARFGECASLAVAVGAAPPRRRTRRGRLRAPRRRGHAGAAELPLPPGGPGADRAGLRAQPRVRRRGLRRSRLPRRRDCLGTGPRPMLCPSD